MSHSWERVPELPYFMKIPCIAYPLFKTLSNLLPYHAQTLSLLLFLMFCFFGWISDRATFDVILHNDIMDLYMSSLGILESEGSCYVFYATRCPGYWGLTYNVFFVGILIWYHTHTYTHTHTHTHKYTQQTQGRIDWHPYKYILPTPVMFSQQPFVLHWMNNSLISKVYFSQILFFLKITQLWKSYYISQLDALRLSSFCEREIILINMV